MFFRGNEPIIIKRQTITGYDDYGNEVYSTQEILIRDALIAFGSTDEPVDASRKPVDASLTLYLPTDTVIQDEDIFEVRERDFVKDGDPENWKSPFEGWNLGVVVKVRRRSG